MQPIELITKYKLYGDNIRNFETNIHDFITENSEIVSHIAENWAAAWTPGFWAKVFIKRHKLQKRKKLVAQFISSILHPHSNFVMDVRTVKTWIAMEESSICKFDQNEITQFYKLIIALEHDNKFIDTITGENWFYFDYFKSKLPYIKENLDVYEGRPDSHSRTFLALDRLVSTNQDEIMRSLEDAKELGEEPNE